VKKSEILNIMSIFKRRDLQEALASFERCVGNERLRQTLKTLNLQGSPKNEKRVIEALAHTWEVMLISSLSKVGSLVYERVISNGKRPDFMLESKELSMIGDIASISDDQQHIKNPTEDFSSILRQLFQDYGPSTGSLSWTINSIDLVPCRPFSGPLQWGGGIRQGTITRLTLPPLALLREFLDNRLRPFIQEIRLSPTTATGIVIDEVVKVGTDQGSQNLTVAFSVQYSPSGSFTYGSYQSFVEVKDITSHVLWRCLNRKHHQFKNANEPIPRVLFICDNSCKAINSSTSLPPGNYSTKDIVNQFWRYPEYCETDGWAIGKEQKDISAIMLIAIEQKPSNPLYLNKREFFLQSCLYENPFCSYPLNFSCKKTLLEVVSSLPSPIESPRNALQQLKTGTSVTRFHEYFSISRNQVSFSLVSLLRILAGDLPVREFCVEYSQNTNPFLNFLTEGRSIRSAKVKSIEDRDDDLIDIEFQAPLSAEVKYQKTCDHNNVCAFTEPSFWLKANDGSVTLSSHVLIEILAGIRSVDEFYKDDIINPFRQALDNCRTIQKVEVNHSMVSILFRDYDSAIGPYRAPRQQLDI